jgi:hypothetical protein
MTPETTIQQPEPADLGDAGSALWASICAGWGLRADEAAILAMACKSLDDIAALEVALDGAELLIPGSARQQVANPLMAELRAIRGQLAALLRQLGRANDVAGPVKSARHVKAANARWSRAD